jgi:hypothetical protein
MKTQLEIEKDVLDYYKKYIETEMIEGALKIDFSDRVNDLVKFPYMYIDYSDSSFFSPNIFDYAVYSIKEKRFVYIEYPWKLENDELTFNKIYL